YPGGPPIPPYDITGWTLAMQMGVKYNRILDGFDGPFTKVTGLRPAPPAAVRGPASPAGYLISHEINNAVKVINRLLKAGADVYWVKAEQQADGKGLGTGTIWVPASAAARPVLDQGAKEFGVPVHAVAKAPTGEALKLKPIRIGLYDSYGGSMPSRSTRSLLQQHQCPFQVVYPTALDAGDLRNKFDVLVFASGAINRRGAGGRGGGGGRGGFVNPDSVPEEYRSWVGRISDDKTIPQIKKFVESGGSI